MNKVTAAVLAAAMVGSMAMPAFAADTTGAITGTTDSTSGNTTVKYEVTQGYEWEIHTEIDFGSNRKNADTNKKITNGDGSSSNEVKVTKNTIPTGKKLVIKVQGNGGGDTTDTSTITDKSFTIKDKSSTATLSYTVTSSFKNGEVATGNEVLSVNAGTAQGSTHMTFVLDTVAANSSEFAGSYEGKLIYTASIEPQNP